MVDDDNESNGGEQQDNSCMSQVGRSRTSKSWVSDPDWNKWEAWEANKGVECGKEHAP
jgi:hypothetical protein